MIDVIEKTNHQEKSGLTGKGMQFCLLKVEGSLTNSQIAHQLGISEATVYRWLKNPETTKEINEIVKDKE